MVQYMKEIFGENLLILPLPHHPVRLLNLA